MGQENMGSSETTGFSIVGLSKTTCLKEKEPSSLQIAPNTKDPSRGENHQASVSWSLLAEKFLMASFKMENARMANLLEETSYLSWMKMKKRTPRKRKS